MSGWGKPMAGMPVGANIENSMKGDWAIADGFDDEECALAATILADLASASSSSSCSDQSSDSDGDSSAGLSGLFKTKMTTKDEVNADLLPKLTLIFGDFVLFLPDSCLDEEIVLLRRFQACISAASPAAEPSPAFPRTPTWRRATSRSSPLEQRNPSESAQGSSGTQQPSRRFCKIPFARSKALQEKTSFACFAWCKGRGA